MKQLLVIFCLFPLLCLAQKNKKEVSQEEVKRAYDSLPKVGGQYEYTEIVLLDSSFKKDQLYKNAKLFFANQFKSAKDVLQYDDRAEGKIVGKGNFHIEEGQSSFFIYSIDKRKVNFTLEIFCKDGKYKYRIYDINADAVMRISSGSGTDNVIRDNLSMDMAYNRTLRGTSKKIERTLFLLTIAQIKVTIDDIKTFMSKPSSNDDF